MHKIKKMSFWNDHAYGGQKRFERLALQRNFPTNVKVYNNLKTGLPQPWEDRGFKLCFNNYECNPDEYCTAKNKCLEGSCQTDAECTYLHQDDLYMDIQGYDSLGYDINPFEPYVNKNAAQEACDANPKCVAYNSYGYLKYQLQDKHLWVQQPVLSGLRQWALYPKIHKLQTKDINALQKPVYKCRNADSDRKIKGVCHTCIECNSNDSCPSGTLCVDGCCAANNCYIADVEDGKWVNGRYDTSSQCNCQSKETPYCCRDGIDTSEVAKCYKDSCASLGKYSACKYMCLAKNSNFNSKFCKADESCCNSGTQEQMCCPSGTCSTDNTCVLKDNQQS